MPSKRGMEPSVDSPIGAGQNVAGKHGKEGGRPEQPWSSED